MLKVFLIFPHLTRSNKEDTQNSSQCSKSDKELDTGLLVYETHLCCYLQNTHPSTCEHNAVYIIFGFDCTTVRVGRSTSQTVCTHHLCSGLYQSDTAADTGGLKCRFLPCSSLTQRTADKRMEKLKR